MCVQTYTQIVCGIPLSLLCYNQNMLDSDQLLFINLAKKSVTNLGGSLECSVAVLGQLLIGEVHVLTWCFYPSVLL